MIFEIVMITISVLFLIALVYLIVINKKQNNFASTSKEEQSFQEKLTRNMTDMLLNSIKQYNDSVTSNLNQIASGNKENIKDIVENQQKMMKEHALLLEKATEKLEVGLEKIQASNEEKLEKMRMTVDEKLSSGLQKRFNESFQIINQRLQEVYEGLGEMKNLATGVGDLKKVLTNVKTRGIWGEVQLGNLLEQMLAPNQFDANVQIKENSAERVDYVVLIPSKDGSSVFLPIDAKFPIEDYQRLLEAYENASKADIEIQTKALIRRIKDEAKKIKEKYINTPHTTDFAILYLPIEGLYAEVMKNAGLSEELQRTQKIMICGPTTLSAMLNTFQLGFKTIAIEKRSAEIWNILGTFKYEFSRFVDLLAKTQKKLDEASKTIEDATKKSRTIERKLKSVSTDVLDETEKFSIEDEVFPLNSENENE